MRADAARNRAKIFEAARALVVEQGEGVRMEDVAAAAGVAVGTLYRHHPTKQALLRAVLSDSAERLAADAEQALAAVVRGGDDPGERLLALLRTYAERFAVDRSVKSAAAALGAPAPDDVRAYPAGGPEQRAAQALEELLARARAAGRVRADIEFGDLVLLLTALPGAEVPDAVRARLVDVVITGLRPVPADAAPRQGS